MLPLAAALIALILASLIGLPPLEARLFTPPAGEPVPEPTRLAADVVGRITWGSLSFAFVAMALVSIRILRRSTQ